MHYNQYNSSFTASVSGEVNCSILAFSIKPNISEAKRH